MRHTYIVEAERGGWTVRHGVGTRLCYETRQQALQTASNMAAIAARRGEKASVVLSEAGRQSEHAVYEPERKVSWSPKAPPAEWRNL